MGLPRLIVLKSNSNKKFLDYKMKNDAGLQGFLQFSGEKVTSASSKFKVENAKEGSGLVHIRSCYNNKYWVKSSPDSYLIAASADEPEEDQTKSTCTLFKPLSDNHPGIDVDHETKSSTTTFTVSNNSSPQGPTVRLYHVQSKHYVCLSQAEGPLDACLFLGSSDPSKTDKSYDVTVIDWESLVILPKHVIFKSPIYGRYIGSSSSADGLYVDVVDPGDYVIPQEVFTNDDGSIRLKSESKGRFWHCNSSNNIRTESTGSDDDDRSSFWPIKVDYKTIVLCNIGSGGLFCGASPNTLRAFAVTMERDALLVVEEPVVARSVYNVDFRVLDARIYDKRVLSMATGDAVNVTDTSTTVDLKMTYKDTKTSTWNAGLSLKIGAKYTFEAGIPFVGEGKITISAEFTGAYQWGQVVTSTNVVQAVYKVTVPKKTRVRLSLIATQASCDIPFSYDQEDILTDGRRVTQTMDDGVYLGTNCYDFKYETVEEKLSAEE